MKLYVKGFTPQNSKVIEVFPETQVRNALLELEKEDMFSVLKKAWDNHNPSFGSGTATIALDDLKLKGYLHQSNSGSMWDCDVDIYSFSQNWDIWDDVDSCEDCIEAKKAEYLLKGWEEEEAYEEACHGFSYPCPHWSEDDQLQALAETATLDWDGINQQLEDYYAAPNQVCQSQENCSNCGMRLEYDHKFGNSRVFTCPNVNYNYGDCHCDRDAVEKLV